MSTLDLQATNDFAADWHVWQKQHRDRLTAPELTYEAKAKEA
jgi:hypothetical protein